MAKNNKKPVVRLGVKDGEVACYVHILDIHNGCPIRGREITNENNRRLLKEGNKIALMDEGGQEMFYEIAYASPLIHDNKNPPEKFIIVFIIFEGET